MRVTASIQRKNRKRKILKLTKGFFGRKNRCYGLAIDMAVRKLKYQYRDRRTIKRNMRSLWIQRINAAVREEGMSYSQFIHDMKTYTGIELNRKSLSELASREDNAFKTIIHSVKAAKEQKLSATA